MTDDIVFSAIIANSSAALKIGDAGDARLMLDMSATEMAAILKLIAYGRGRELEVTVRIKGGNNGEA